MFTNITLKNGWDINFCGEIVLKWSNIRTCILAFIASVPVFIVTALLLWRQAAPDPSKLLIMNNFQNEQKLYVVLTILSSFVTFCLAFTGVWKFIRTREIDEIKQAENKHISRILELENSLRKLFRVNNQLEAELLDIKNDIKESERISKKIDAIIDEKLRQKRLQ